MRLSEDAEQNTDSLLQDLVNLSGANWRGFNAKSAPVSVFYCHLVADLVHDFHAHGLPLPKIVDLRNVYEPTDMRELGFEYVGVGR